MRTLVVLVCSLVCAIVQLHAETGYAAWLRYAPIEDPNVREIYLRLPAATVALDASVIEQTAQQGVDSRHSQHAWTRPEDRRPIAG